MASTHSEYVGNGHYVTYQFCEHSTCSAYLGVNYPSIYCDKHR